MLDVRVRQSLVEDERGAGGVVVAEQDEGARGVGVADLGHDVADRGLREHPTDGPVAPPVRSSHSPAAAAAPTAAPSRRRPSSAATPPAAPSALSTPMGR